MPFSASEPRANISKQMSKRTFQKRDVAKQPNNENPTQRIKQTEILQSQQATTCKRLGVTRASGGGEAMRSELVENKLKQETCTSEDLFGTLDRKQRREDNEVNNV